ncbi:MAG: hypothetical protein JNK82_15075 [Myxococcaceae bacterium]|nr:hypothetical protein [Myxococcaceae bacterium]
MIARGLVCAVLVLSPACLPVPHELEGRACVADADCVNARRSDLVCHRQVCTVRGTFGAVDLVLAHAASEGGVEGAAATPVRPSLSAFTASGTVTAPRFGATAAGGFVVGGTGTAEVLGPAGAFTALPSARSQVAAAVAGGRLFVIGGTAEAGAPLAEVLSAPLEGGEWAQEPALAAPRTAAQAIAAGGRVYLLGGEAATGLSAEVLVAELNGEGRLGPWRSAGQLPAPRARAGAALFDGHVYLAGGSCSGACPPVVAPVLSDGGLGAFTALPAFTPERESPAVVVAGGALHVIGGRQGSGQVLAEVLSLPLGTGTPWQTQPRLPRALYGAAAREVNGAIELTGGRGTDGGTLAEQWSAFTTTAGAEPFQRGPNVPEESQYGALVAWNGALYTAGGHRNSSVLDTIFRAEAGPDGALGPWRLAGNLPAPTAELGVAAWGGRFYLLNGCRDFAGNCLSISESYSAPFFADGGVGAMRPEPSLAAGDEVSGFAVSAVNGALYAAGGVIGYGPTRREVWRTNIELDGGGLSPLSPVTALPGDAGLWGHALVEWRGNLYAVGGQGAGGYGLYSDRVLQAALLPDGTVSQWSVAARLPQQRGRVSAAVYDDTLYVVNGCNETMGGSFCSTYPPSLLAAPLFGDGGVGPFAALLNHPNPARGAQLALLGGRLVTVAGYDGNPQPWSFTSELHGRGRLGPARPATVLPPSTTAAAGAYTFGAGGEVSPGPSLPEAVQAAAATPTALFAVAGTRVWRGALPVTEWVELPALPRALATPVMAGSFVAEGRTVFALVGGAWAEWSAPAGVERLALSGAWLFAFGGAGDVYVTGTQAEAWRRVEGLPGPRPGVGAVASDGMLYVAGGGGLRDVLVSSVGSDGTLGPWSHVGTLPAAWPAVTLVAHSGQLFAHGAGEARSWPLFTPPARGTFSLRVDLGGDVTAVEGITLEGEGEWSVTARLAGPDGVFGESMALGHGRPGQELRVGRPGRYLFLTFLLHGESRLTGGKVATRL